MSSDPLDVLRPSHATCQAHEHRLNSLNSLISTKILLRAAIFLHVWLRNHLASKKTLINPPLSLAPPVPQDLSPSAQRLLQLLQVVRLSENRSK